MKNIENMLCYMESEDLYELAQEILNGSVEIELSLLLPYMDEEDVDKICNKLADDPNFACDISLSDLLPFASEKGVDALFLRYAEQGKFDEKALPFVSEECLHKFVVSYCENPNSDIDIDALYPYLESKDLSLLLKTYLKNHKKQQ